MNTEDMGRKMDLRPTPAAAEACAALGITLVYDTPERLPDLIGEFGDHFAEVDLEDGETRLPVLLTLHRAVLLEAQPGGDEADVALALSFEDAEALGVRLIEQARRGRESVSLT